MNKQDSIYFIQNILESSFDRDRFFDLIVNIFKDRQEHKHKILSGTQFPQAFSPYIQKHEYAFKFVDKQRHEIAVFITYLKTESAFNARVRQRNFVLNRLKTREKDAAIVAFVHPNQKDWRLSFVRLDYEIVRENGKIKDKENITSAKRYSFLVGPHEKSYTAKKQLLPLINSDTHPTIDDIEQAFSVEKVTKEFFIKYKELFYRAEEALRKVLEQDSKIAQEFKDKGISTVDFAKKLLGQIVFLYFLQKKGWLGVPKDKQWGEGSKTFLRDLFDGKIVPYDNFFNDILEPLSYEALSTDRGKHAYYDKLKYRIPFLNGGLFEPLRGYSWETTDIILPNTLFSNNNPTKEGDEGDGIFDVFDRFNFTIKEDEPLDKEVAIDPEMLGKVFENLLEVKDRKSKGTYYTPREIVHYMCQESLIYHLSTELEGKVSEEDIRTLVTKGTNIVDYELARHQEGLKLAKEAKMPPSIKKHAQDIDKKLEDIKVVDPAVGSGAFLVGMMNEIVNLRNILKTYIPANQEKTDYDFKLHAIQHSLYGVDIDPGAVEIAKLRLWLSLVVDEESVDSIRPLPNLDYKIMQGNSLLEEYERIKLFDENLIEQNNKQQGVLDLEWKSTPISDKLQQKRDKYFRTTAKTEKEKLREEIEQLEWDLIETTLKETGKADKITDIRKIKKSNNRPFFLWKLYFAEVFDRKGGFDIVIGNPPYVSLEKIKENKDKYKKLYQVFAPRGDLYTLFYERGLKLTKDGGYLVYITSNKWMRAGYGKKLRGYFTQKNPLKLIDFGGFKVFENATVDTNVLLIQNTQNQNHLEACHFKNDYQRGQSIAEYFVQNKVVLDKLTGDTWFIATPAEIKLKEKIEKIGVPLKEWKDIKIYRGILTGLNKAFIVNEETRQQILANCKTPKERERTEKIIKPVLRGRDIKRYCYEWKGTYLLFIPWHFPLHYDDTIEGASKLAEKEFQTKYPSLYSYLLQFKDQLSKRNKAETGIRYEWYALQRCAATYYEEFEKEKIIWQEIVREPQFHYDTEGFYVEATGFIMTGKHLKYICALLNSKLVSHIFKTFYAGGGLGEEGYRYKKAFLENLPLPPVTSENFYMVREINKLVIEIVKTKRKNNCGEMNTINLEHKINRLVNEIYTLTPGEIKIIEQIR